MHGKIDRIFKALVAGLAVAVLLAILVLGINAGQLRNTISGLTNRYLVDISAEIAQQVNYRVEEITENLVSLGDSIIRLGEDQLPEFLKRKAQLYQFRSIGIVDLEGNGWLSNGERYDFSDQPAFQWALQGERAASVVQSDRLLCAAPVWEEDRVIAVTVGIKTTDKMQELLATKAFSGQASCCILDRTGQLVVGAQEAGGFREIEAELEAGTRASSRLAAEKMDADLQQNRGGAIAVQAEGGCSWILRYDPLNVHDWYLLTLIPADVISAGTDVFQTQSLVITGISIALMGTVLILVLIISRRHRKRLEALAYEDPVTGGMNSMLFEQLAQARIAAAPPKSFALVSLNIRNFKLINDLYSSADGNRVLQHVWATLFACLRDQEELVARSQADIFHLLLHYDGDAAIAQRLDGMAERINAFNDERPDKYFLNTVEGIYVIDDPQLDLVAIQSRASVARKSAKEDYRNTCVFYDEAARARLIEEKEITNLMESALQNREFLVYLQPKISLGDRRPAGAEALVRWRNPERGMIYPSSFIPVFERNGFIRKLDLYVFEETCSMLQEWARAGKQPLPVSVNLSRQHLDQPDFLERFAMILNRYDVSPAWLELEFTESVLLDRMDEVQEAIAGIHRLGMSCSLDDFGAGYSALGLLKSLPVDTLKLDREFFVDDTDRGRWVVAAVVGLAQQLGMRTVAEGIEQPEQLAELERAGCDMVQGYVFSPPLPRAEFEERYL